MSFLKTVQRFKVEGSDRFTSEIEDIYLSRADYTLLGFAKEEQVSLKKAKLVWGIEPEYRSYGVKDFGVYVPDQTIEVSCEKDTEQGSEDFTVSLSLKDVEIRFENKDLSGSPGLYPTELSYFNKAWSVTFLLG